MVTPRTQGQACQWFPGLRVARAAASPYRTVAKAEIDKWMTGECSDWGRWGKTDQMGAVNFITEQFHALRRIAIEDDRGTDPGFRTRENDGLRGNSRTHRCE